MRHSVVHDFNDFVQYVKETECHVHQMSPMDFFDWQKGVSDYKLRKADPRFYLSGMISVEFKRGQTNLFFKTLDTKKTQKLVCNSEPEGWAKKRRSDFVRRAVNLRAESAENEKGRKIQRKAILRCCKWS